MKTSNLKPWNWFKDENGERGGQLPVPTQRETRDMWESFQGRMEDMYETMQKNIPTWSKSFMRPDIDIRETDKSYEITAEVPGVDEKDITLEVGDHSLILKGHKKTEYEEGKSDSEFHRVERSYGSFKRVLNLPEDVDAESAEATFDKGVLSVTLKRIEVPNNLRKVEIKKKAA